MANLLKYCSKCRCVYNGTRKLCPRCNNALVVSDYDADMFALLDDEHKSKATKRLFDDDNVKEFLLEDNKQEVNKNSRIGNAIKTMATIVTVLSVIGSVIIMFGAGFPVGIASLIISLLIGLLAYGIGEICSLLSSIDYRLDQLSKK